MRHRGRRHQGRRAGPRGRHVHLHDGPRPSATRAPGSRPPALRPGDRILLSGRIGDHGTAIMLARGEFELGADIESDTRPLWPAVDALLDAAGPALRCLRDATRGGVASVLNELARASGVAIVVREADVPVHPAVAGAAEILGIDPMHVANEGKLVAIVAPGGGRGGARGAARGARAARRRPRSARSGRSRPAMVLVETAFGGRRVMDQLVGDPLPRICCPRNTDARALHRRVGGPHRVRARGGPAGGEGGAEGRAPAPGGARRAGLRLPARLGGHAGGGRGARDGGGAGRRPLPRAAGRRASWRRSRCSARCARGWTWSWCGARSCWWTRWSSTKTTRRRTEGTRDGR